MPHHNESSLCRNTPVGRETLVHIAISHSVAGWWIRVYPDPEGVPPQIFTPGLGVPSPVLPRQIRWIATGLKQGQYIIIRPKKSYGGIFGLDPSTHSDRTFQIPFDDPCVQSGIPRWDGGKGIPYEYGIELWGADQREPLALYPPAKIRDHQLATLDPVVVIKDE